MAFCEDALLRFELLKGTNMCQAKSTLSINQNGKSNNDLTVLAKIFCASFYQKLE